MGKKDRKLLRNKILTISTNLANLWWRLQNWWQATNKRSLASRLQCLWLRLQNHYIWFFEMIISDFLPTWNSTWLEFLQVLSCKLGHKVAWLCTCRPPHSLRNRPTHHIDSATDPPTRRVTWNLGTASHLGRWNLLIVLGVSRGYLEGVWWVSGRCLL